MARISMPVSVVAALALGAAVASPAGATDLPAGASAGVGLGASLDSCSRSADPGRSAVFSATMPAIEKASRLQMRFDLFSRPDFGGIWKPVTGVATFGTWDGSAPGAGGLKVTKQVGALRLGSAYRATVRFRWLTDAGAVVRSAFRVSKVCAQPDLRPDLAVAARATASGRFVVALRNAGRAARAFDVEITSGSKQLAVRRVPGMGAGRADVMVFSGVECQPGAPVRVTVDPRGELTERNELNNVAELKCPASS